MAELKYNVVTHGVSGKVGDLIVFSQRNGKTIIGKIPAKGKSKSAKQQAINDKFLEASRYAKGAMFRPDVKARYARKAETGQSAYTRAMADFFTIPKVSYVDLTNYRGQVDDLIRVQVEELGALDYVKISVTKADGTLVEEGQAQRGTIADEWMYMATKKNTALSGSIILISVANLAGNTSSEQKVIS